MWFYNKNPQKVDFFFAQIARIIQGHFIEFSPEKSDFSSKCACISSTILTFLPNNLLCFYTKNSQKVNFSSNCAYNTGHFIDFSPEKSYFFSKFACISSTILTFLPNNPLCFYTKNSQKVHFPSNCAYNIGHFIDFSPKKKVIFPQYAPAYRALFDFFA